MTLMIPGIPLYFVVASQAGKVVFVTEKAFSEINDAIRHKRYLKNVFDFDTCIYKGLMYEPVSEQAKTDDQLQQAFDNGREVEKRTAEYGELGY